MERLTRKTKTGNYTSADKSVSIRQVYDKLGAYEDAEEQGLMLRLPCPIGTKVYFINYYEDDDFGHYEVASGTFNYSWLDFPRKFYLTKEEAEKALKQMGE